MGEGKVEGKITSKSKNNIKMLMQLLGSLLLGALFLSFSLSGLEVDASKVGEQLSQVSPLSLILYALGFLSVHAIRVWRWRYLLRPLGQTDTAPIIHAGLIGFSAIMILPFRLGEFVRPYYISKQGSISMSAALGTAVVERVIDGLAITALLFATLATQDTRPEATPIVWSAALISGGIFGSTLIVLLLSWWKRAPTLAMLKRLGDRFSQTLTHKILNLLNGFLDGVSAISGGKDFYLFLLSTLLYWALNGATIAFLANAFGLDIGLWQGMTLLSILVIGIMIPGGPGHVGTFEYFMRIGLGLFLAIELHEEGVLAFIVAIHTIQFVIQVGAGIPSWLFRGFSLRQAFSGAPNTEKSLSNSSH